MIFDKNRLNIIEMEENEVMTPKFRLFVEIPTTASCSF